MYNRRRHATAGLHLACRESGTCAGPRHRPPDSGGGVSHAASRRFVPRAIQVPLSTARTSPPRPNKRTQLLGRVKANVKSRNAGRFSKKSNRIMGVCASGYRVPPATDGGLFSLALGGFCSRPSAQNGSFFFCGGNMREQASNRPALGVPDVIPSMQRVHHRRKTAAAAAAAAAAATAQRAGWLVRWIAGRDQAGQQAPAVWSAHLT